MLITMLDRLRQGERLWDHQRRTPPFARQHTLSIGPHQDAPIAVPAIAEPVQLALLGAGDCGGHGSLDQVLVQEAGGTGDDEATVPVLDQAAPALSFVRLVNCPHCHSDRLKKQVIVVCQECGAIISESTSDINPDAAGNLPLENNRETQGQVADERPEPEPTTPPMGDESADGLQGHNENQAMFPNRQNQAQQPNQADRMTAATQLLVEIVGPAPVHIEMSARGPKKYWCSH